MAPPVLWQRGYPDHSVQSGWTPTINGANKLTIRLEGLEERLVLPNSLASRYNAQGRCKVCETPLGHLRQEASAMIRSIQLAQHAASGVGQGLAGSPGGGGGGVVGLTTNIPALVGSCSTPQHRYGRGKVPGQGYGGTGPSAMPLAAQAQAYLEHNVRAWMNPHKYQVRMAVRLCSPGWDEQWLRKDGVTRHTSTDTPQWRRSNLVTVSSTEDVKLSGPHTHQA
ncbi:hypothetical protein ACOMHN_023165 [Nucella lapillus]